MGLKQKLKIKNFIKLFFGELTHIKIAGWIVVFILFILFYVFFWGNLLDCMLYLLILTLPPIWIATIIGGTFEIIKIMRRTNKKGG